MLDGQTSLDEIKDRFEAEFPPQKITVEELQQFVGMLHRSGLVIADVPGPGPTNSRSAATSAAAGAARQAEQHALASAFKRHRSRSHPQLAASSA